MKWFSSNTICIFNILA